MSKIIYKGIYCRRCEIWIDILDDTTVKKLEKRGYRVLYLPCESHLCENCFIWNNKLTLEEKERKLREYLALVNFIELIYG